MAHKSLLKKLSSLVISSRLLTQKPYIQSLRVLSPTRSFSGHAIETMVTDESNEEYIKWHNGGGLVHRSGVTFCARKTCVVEVGAVVHSGASIYENVHIGSGTVVGHDVSIGRNTKIGCNVSLANCHIGESCIIHSGVCIGQDGFGFLLGDDGNMQKKPQNLRVMIGDNVEIGANTCIDRGSWRDTSIGNYSKIDNLVQIGHNVVIGKNCLLCGQVGIAGSATLEDYVTLGGRVAVRDHVSIASKVRLAANSCVTKNILVAGDYGGFPAVPIREWRKQVAMDRKVQHETFPEVKTCQEVEVSSKS